MTIRFGFLTTARINDALLDGVERTPLAEVVAVGSRDPARAEAYAREKGIARAHRSYEGVLADPEVDAVYIALPNALHVEWAIRALEAGKHVLCEKPMSQRAAEVARAFDAAEAADRVLMEAFMYRHQPQVKRLKALVEDGAIGELRLVRAQFSFTLTEPENVRWIADLGGGALLDVGTYCVSISRHVAGDPEVVYGTKVVAPGGADSRFAGILRFAGDVLGHFDCGFDLPRRHEVEVVGSEGLLTLSPAFGRDDGVLELHREDEVERIVVPATHRYALQVENFCRAVAGEEPPLLDRRESIGQAATLEALLASAESGEPVPVVPRA
jgi:predicted dehydrogenase